MALCRQRNPEELAEDIRRKVRELNNLIAEAAFNRCTVALERDDSRYVAGNTGYNEYAVIIRRIL